MAEDLIEYRRNFGPVKFPRQTIKQVVDAAASALDAEGTPPGYQALDLWRGSEQWGLPSMEQFLTEIGLGYRSFTVIMDWGTRGRFGLSFDSNLVLSVKAPTRSVVEDLSEFVSSVLGSGELLIRPKDPVRVFIGHGRSQEWKKLKDHLTDLHRVEVEAYEVASRSGFSIREVLDSMLENSSLAFLVMTAEDLQDDGSSRARQNVVHEAGLFQGRLGFQRAVILREEGVESLSNLDGIQYIEFSKDNIREVFGEVLGVIRREFPDALARA